MNSTNPNMNENQLLQRIIDEGLEKVIPKRRKGEAGDAFMSRCMGNPTMNQEFPDRSQRAAVCMRERDKR